ncbi:MAG: amidase family protein, partial [Pseudomonadota bacterium]
MKFEDYRKYDMTGLADLVARREVSGAELLQTALERTAAVNPQINAVTHDLADFARQELARGPKGRFAGVPFLLKDLGAQLAGTVTTGGSRAFADVRAEADSAIVAAYRRAGLVIFGKTNTPEFGLAPVTEPTLFGASR